MVVAGGMGLVLLLAPLLLLRNPTAPERGDVVAAAGPIDAAFALRRFTSRAGRSSAVGRVALAVATSTTTTTAAPAPSTTEARRRAAAAVHTTTTTTTPRPRPAPTTTTTTRRPPAPPPAPPPTTTAPPAHSQTGEASWYRGPDGECAHNTAPLGAIIRVTNLANGRSTTCRVAGRGPYGAGRIVDLTQSTFARIASVDAGVIRARVDW